MMFIIELWSLAVFLASVFAAVLTGITLQPRYKKRICVIVWFLAAVFGYTLIFFSYRVSLYNDFVGILGGSVIVCIISQVLYAETRSTKLVVALMSCLLGNVITFMVCGTADALIAPVIGLIRESAYEVPNILFFIGIKLIVYSTFTFFYIRFLRKHIYDTIAFAEGNMSIFVPALIVSVVGFYVINLFSNKNNIYPGNIWFLPLYSTVCAIVFVEFWMIFYAMNQRTVMMKITAELNVATAIQQSMLPCIFPAFPDRKDVDIYAAMSPAREVGGDFYDFFMVDEKHVAIVMADVSGKGIPAALFMVIGKTLIKDHTQPGMDLGTVFFDVNNILCESNSEEMFITAFEGVLDLETGEFFFVNAGHEYPFICRNGKLFELFRISSGFVLAGMKNIRYCSGCVNLEAGDKIFQYTDGVTEAVNAQNEFYGLERLNAVLKKNSNMTPEELLPAVRKDIDKFVGNTPQFDDITMLCMEYRGVKA